MTASTITQVTETDPNGNRLTFRLNGGRFLIGATAKATSPGLSGPLENTTATVNVTVPLDQPAILAASATFLLVASAGTGPVYAEGEEVTHVRVAATFGGASTVTYLTASGGEVPAEQPAWQW